MSLSLNLQNEQYLPGWVSGEVGAECSCSGWEAWGQEGAGQNSVPQKAWWGGDRLQQHGAPSTCHFAAGHLASVSRHCPPKWSVMGREGSHAHLET